MARLQQRKNPAEVVKPDIRCQTCTHSPVCAVLPRFAEWATLNAVDFVAVTRGAPDVEQRTTNLTRDLARIFAIHCPHYQQEGKTSGS